MSRNIITYNLNSEVATVNGVHLDKEQSIEITKIIDEKDQRIAELEQKLENAIVPKFKVGDEVYFVDEFSINKVKVLNRNVEINYDCINENIEETLVKYSHCVNEGEFEEVELFATEQEAQQKLKELEEKQYENRI